MFDEIGGWLIFLGMILLSRAVMQIFPLLGLWRYTDVRNWLAMTTPGLATYHHLWGIAIILELVYRIFYVIFDLFLILLFIQRRRTFPVMMIAVLVSVVVFVVTTEILYQKIYGDLAPSKAVSSPIVSTVFWTYYLLTPKRVRGTFTR